MSTDEAYLARSGRGRPGSDATINHSAVARASCPYLRYAAAFVVAICSAARAADIGYWTLTTGDLRRTTAQLSAIGPTGVALAATADQPAREVRWDDLASLERTSPPPTIDGKITLVLANGSRLVGTPGALGETSLQWREQKLGSITVPLRQVRSIDRGALPPPTSSPTDRVQFTNGDAVTGVITDVADDSISIKTDTATSTLPLSTIQRVTFADVSAGARPATAPSGVVVRLSLDDGSQLDATDLGSNGGTITFTPVGSKKATSIAVESVSALQHVNGPVAWLAARPPATQISSSYIPFAPGVPAKFGGSSSYDIEVRPLSVLTYDIETGWTRLHAKYRLKKSADEVTSWADVTVRVRVGDHVAYEKLHVRGDSPDGDIDVPITGAKRVSLEVDFGATGGADAVVDWIEPALLRQSISATAGDNFASPPK